MKRANNSNNRAFPCLIKIYLFLSLQLAFDAFASEPLPVDAFAKLPDIQRIVLSPNGLKLAFMSHVDAPDWEGTLVSVFDLQTNTTKTLLSNDNIKFTLIGLIWANDDVVLLSALFPAVRAGTPTTETRLLKLDINSGKIDNVINRRAYRRYDRVPQFQNRIVDILPNDSDNILLALDSHQSGDRRVYKVNLKSGKQSIVQKTKANVQDWLTDRQHRIRLGLYRNDTTYRILIKDLETTKWKTRWEYEAFSENQITPIGFDEDPNLLYVRKYHNGREAIFSVDLSKSEDEMTLVFSDPNYDVQGGLIYSQSKKKVLGISYAETGGYTFWDEEYVAFQKGLDRSLPDTENYIYGTGSSDRRYLVLATSDVDSGTYYYGDRDKKSLTPIAKRYKNLDPKIMRPKKSLRYEARDGLSIQAFLTLPNDDDIAHPTLIFPHGGPISYSDGGFDYWTQFFANRGYAVLQMNFRGSDGYGYDFMQAGLQSWGQEMQNDVEDGARWLIEQGIADENQMCIVGASYGGYAALMGAVRNPDMYRCVISFAGIGDVVDLVKSHRRYTNYQIVKKQVGDDFSELRKNSPVEFAKNFEAPVLLIHGTKDRNVKVQQSREMHQKLKRAGKDVEYLEIEDANHYLSNSKHRVQTFTAMDEFLSKHLPIAPLAELSESE